MKSFTSHQLHRIFYPNHFKWGALHWYHFNDLEDILSSKNFIFNIIDNDISNTGGGSWGEDKINNLKNEKKKSIESLFSSYQEVYNYFGNIINCELMSGCFRNKNEGIYRYITKNNLLFEYNVYKFSVENPFIEYKEFIKYDYNEEEILNLMNDKDSNKREIAARSSFLSEKDLLTMIKDKDIMVRENVIKNPNITKKILEFTINNDKTRIADFAKHKLYNLFGE